jgi:hypothetical protein
MKPEANKKQITVYGEPDPILQAYTGTENSPVIAAGLSSQKVVYVTL